MKYSDMERVDRIKTYTRKILEYVNDKNITRDAKSGEFKPNSRGVK